MSIGSLAQLMTGQSTNLQRSTNRVRDTLQQLAVSADSDIARRQDSTDISTKRFEQSAGSLRQAGLQTAEASAVIAIAKYGLSQAVAILGRLAELAESSVSEKLDTPTREKNSNQFKVISAQLDTLAQNTQFAGKPLLAGARIDLLNAQDNRASFVFGDVRTYQMFAGEALSLLTSEDASRAATMVASARAAVKVQREEIDNLEEGISLISTNFDVALQNNDAAQSLVPKDGEPDMLSVLLESAAASLQAQGNRLQPSVLNLIQP